MTRETMITSGRVGRNDETDVGEASVSLGRLGTAMAARSEMEAGHVVVTGIACAAICPRVHEMLAVGDAALLQTYCGWCYGRVSRGTGSGVGRTNAFSCKFCETRYCSQRCMEKATPSHLLSCAGPVDGTPPSSSSSHAAPRDDSLRVRAEDAPFTRNCGRVGNGGMTRLKMVCLGLNGDEMDDLDDDEEEIANAELELATEADGDDERNADGAPSLPSTSGGSDDGDEFVEDISRGDIILICLELLCRSYCRTAALRPTDSPTGAIAVGADGGLLVQTKSGRGVGDGGGCDDHEDPSVACLRRILHHMHRKAYDEYDLAYSRDLHKHRSGGSSGGSSGAGSPSASSPSVSRRSTSSRDVGRCSGPGDASDNNSFLSEHEEDGDGVDIFDECAGIIFWDESLMWLKEFMCWLSSLVSTTSTPPPPPLRFVRDDANAVAVREISHVSLSSFLREFAYQLEKEELMELAFEVENFHQIVPGVASGSRGSEGNEMTDDDGGGEVDEPACSGRALTVEALMDCSERERCAAMIEMGLLPPAAPDGAGEERESDGEIPSPLSIPAQGMNTLDMLVNVRLPKMLYLALPPVLPLARSCNANLDVRFSFEEGAMQLVTTRRIETGERLTLPHDVGRRGSLFAHSLAHCWRHQYCEECSVFDRAMGAMRCEDYDGAVALWRTCIEGMEEAEESASGTVACVGPGVRRCDDRSRQGIIYYQYGIALLNRGDFNGCRTQWHKSNDAEARRQCERDAVYARGLTALCDAREGGGASSFSSKPSGKLASGGSPHRSHGGPSGTYPRTGSKQVGRQFIFTSDQLLSREECDGVIAACESHGWTASRHISVPTTDVPVADVPVAVEALNAMFERGLAEILVTEFPGVFLSRGCIRVHDAFVVKYRADGKCGLPSHTDQSEVSLTISLNDGFEGGGTRFEVLEACTATGENPVVAPTGACTLFHGDLFHGGEPIVSGTRYIIAAFLYGSSPISTCLTQDIMGIIADCNVLSGQDLARLACCSHDLSNIVMSPKNRSASRGLWQRLCTARWPKVPLDASMHRNCFKGSWLRLYQSRHMLGSAISNVDCVRELAVVSILRTDRNGYNRTDTEREDGAPEHSEGSRRRRCVIAVDTCSADGKRIVTCDCRRFALACLYGFFRAVPHPIGSPRPAVTADMAPYLLRAYDMEGRAGDQGRFQTEILMEVTKHFWALGLYVCEHPLAHRSAEFKFIRSVARYFLAADKSTYDGLDQGVEDEHGLGGGGPISSAEGMAEIIDCVHECNAIDVVYFIRHITNLVNEYDFWGQGFTNWDAAVQMRSGIEFMIGFACGEHQSRESFLHTDGMMLRVSLAMLDGQLESILGEVPTITQESPPPLRMPKTHWWWWGLGTPDMSAGMYVC